MFIGTCQHAGFLLLCCAVLSVQITTHTALHTYLGLVTIIFFALPLFTPLAQQHKPIVPRMTTHISFCTACLLYMQNMGTTWLAAETATLCVCCMIVSC